jgi:hypothetical protein
VTRCSAVFAICSSSAATGNASSAHWRSRHGSGLTPSLSQSGESSSQGAITKTGSMLARRLLVESAWHYSRPPRLGATLANRQQEVSPIRSSRSPTVLSSAFTASTAGCAPAASHITCLSWPAHASSRASSGPPPPTNRQRQPSGREAGAPGHQAAGTRAESAPEDAQAPPREEH